MYAVIMAGGGGTRLWPLSRSRRPKPFLPLLEDDRTLLEAAISRLAPLIAPEDVYIVTDTRYAPLVREVAPQVPAANIIGEPFGRNTAAAVALMAHAVERRHDEIMVVLPADSAVRDAEGYRQALSAAAERAAEGDLVTLGVEPTEPSTGYGYVRATGEAGEHGGLPTYRVGRFEEKPTPERARELVGSGSAFWNAGIFVWQRSAAIAGLEAYSADISDPIRDWCVGNPPSGEAGWPGAALAEVYRHVRDTSIDYALLEPASLEAKVAVVPISVGWSDLGSWSALRDQRAAEGSAVITTEGEARVIDVDSRDVLVHAAGGRTVATVGLEGVIVIDTPDALLVISVDAAQDVKKVVEQLKDEQSDLL
jgi:mannose-1-phosphate guanylyltransferase